MLNKKIFSDNYSVIYLFKFIWLW